MLNKFETVSDVYKYVKTKLKTWYKKSSRQEITEALTSDISKDDNLSQYYLYSMQNDNVSNCEKVAQNGFAPAQYDLAISYLYGDGINKDIYKAIYWLEKAADQNHHDALRKLINIYRTNHLIKRNDYRADYWEERLKGASKEEIGEITEIKEWMIEVINPNEAKPEKKSKEKVIVGTNLDLRFDSFKTVEQDFVINADTNKSFLINAGPGTGKTYALIQRIAYLVSKDVDPDGIVVLSFTTAVEKEIQKRLKQLIAESSDNKRELANTFVRTYHKLAWWLLKQANANFDEDEWEPVNLSFGNMDYEEGLIKATDLINDHDDIVSGWQYLIVDEIQDINNGKAYFVLALVKACLKYNVPVMLLGDSCQAIYNYLSDDCLSCSNNMSSDEFYREIMKLLKNKAEMVSFGINHRQKNDLQISNELIRTAILKEDPNECHSCIREYNFDVKKINLNKINDFVSQNPDKTICFMERANIETKILSAKLHDLGIDHRCVLDVSKDLLPKWFGYIFSGYDKEAISKNEFTSLVNVNIADKKIDIDKAWSLLQDAVDTSSEIITFSDLARVFLKNKFDMDCFKEEEQKISVSNVHRAKGLEFDIVIMDENLSKISYRDILDESKVFYVGITRPKENLLYLDTDIYWKRKKGDKTSRIIKKTRINDEWQYAYIVVQNNLSRNQMDVSPENFIFEDEAEMYEAQKNIRLLSKNAPIELHYDESVNNYKIIAKYAGKELLVGWMPKSFVNSIKRRDGKFNTPLPDKLVDLYSEGTYTHVASQDGFLEKYDYKISQLENKYSKNKVWNYIMFSGPARAVYEDR